MIRPLTAIAQMKREQERSLAWADLPQAAYVLLAAKDQPGSAAALAEHLNCSDRVTRIVKKGGALYSGNAESLVDLRVVNAAFSERLRSIGVFDRLLGDGMIRAPLRTRVVASTTAISANEVGEGQATPVASLDLSQDQIEPVKCAAIIAVTQELLTASASAGQAFVARALTRGVVACTDTTFLSGIAPSPVASGGGSDPASVASDVKLLFDAVAVSAESILWFILPPLLAKRLSTLVGTDGRAAFPNLASNGGTLFNVPVLVTDGLEADEAMLVDATAVAGDTDLIVLDRARHASLELASATQSSTSPPGVVGAATTSLWQTNSRAIRATRTFGFKVIRNDGVAMLDGVVWGATGSPPM